MHFYVRKYGFDFLTRRTELTLDAHYAPVLRFFPQIRKVDAEEGEAPQRYND